MSAIYEFRQLDEHGVVKSRTSRACETEADAVELGCQMADGCDVEIWCGGRRVTIVTAAVDEPDSP